jgi:signal transduction histidine kinase
MPWLRSLKNRIFVAAALLAVLPMAVVLEFVSARVARQSEEGLHRGLRDAVRRLAEYQRARVDTLTDMARLIADLPKLKAAVATGDRPTVEPLARDYMARTHSDMFVLLDRRGGVLAALGAQADPSDADVDGAVSFRVDSERLLEVVAVPLYVGPEPLERLGTLRLGFSLDDTLAARLKALVDCEIVFVKNGRAYGSTLPHALARDLLALPTDVPGMALNGAYLGLRRPLPSTGPMPEVLVLRSRAESLRFLRTLRLVLAIAAMAAMAVAILLSYAVARTVTEPLAALTAAMREITITGDLTRRIPAGGRWHDEDVRVLTRTFNTLTGSIGRFQRDLALKERLSALGRLSTVIAHEVRNPAMIIKTTLRALRSERPDPHELREAADDIDHELTRLDRTIGDVLDYARPPRVELATVDLATLCREICQGTSGHDPAVRCALSLDPALGEIVTDADRLRTILVNIIENARQSVDARQAQADTAETNRPAGIELSARRVAPDRVILVVSDQGGGIAPADLPHLFEPYFTTRRTGTGLGLAIAKNLVEALGGTITAAGQLGVGAQITIELPSDASQKG